jgi:hydroxyacylglutathione hydrolase
MAKCTVMVDDDDLKVIRLEAGPYGTNAYVVVCKETNESLVVDAPGEAEKLRDFVRGTTPKYILITHKHLDHTGALVALQDMLHVPVGAHEADAPKLPFVPSLILADGDALPLGKLTVKVLHTPGHSPGSLCFLVGRVLLAGDTLFPGGPGKTRTPEDFQQVVAAITEKLFPLPDDTRVLPGHGESTVLQKEKAAYASFAARPHKPDLCGDVLWLTA